MSEILRVPKLCGADVELGNFTLGRAQHEDSIREASRAVLAEIAAAGVSAGTSRVSDDELATDHSRTFLHTNGGCAYIDLDHLELCLPEVVSAYDFVAGWHAVLRIARDALSSANAHRAPRRQIKLLANNSDGLGHSYGSHLNVLVTRTAWHNLVHRKPHFLAYLAAFQASSLPLTGQGKVGSENGARRVDYQLSQRADFFETMQGIQTTWRRPLVNTRDEALCGRSLGARDDLARLHIIFFDSTLCHVATLLRVGMTQLVVAMIEAGKVDSTLALDDPLAAVAEWSHDPTLGARAPLVSGELVTAVQLQRRFLEQAQQFVDSGQATGIVPRAADIIALWDDTLTKLERHDWPALMTRLDWVLKRELLARVLDKHPHLDWRSPEIKHLDLIFSSLDSSEGLFWNFAERGLIEEVVTDSEITLLATEPPRDTRAWGRTMLLRRAAGALDVVDWDFVRLKLRDARGVEECWRVDFEDPLGANATTLPESLLDATSLEELLDACGATREPAAPTPARRAPRTSYWWPAIPSSTTSGPGIGLLKLGQPSERNRATEDTGGDHGTT